MHRIEGSVSIVTGKGILVRPPVANIPQLAHVGPLAPAKNISKDRVPLIPDHPEQELGVGRRHPLSGLGSRDSHSSDPVAPVLRPALSLHERCEALSHQSKRPTDAFVVCHRHGGSLLHTENGPSLTIGSPVQAQLWPPMRGVRSLSKMRPERCIPALPQPSPSVGRGRTSGTSGLVPQQSGAPDEPPTAPHVPRLRLTAPSPCAVSPPRPWAADRCPDHRPPAIRHAPADVPARLWTTRSGRQRGHQRM